LFLLPEESRIVNLLSGREIGKRFQADIDADLRIRWRQGIKESSNQDKLARFCQQA